MRKVRDFVVRGNDVFVGLEDSKRSWKLCVRSEGTIVNQTSMPAEYQGLLQYLRRRFPECRIKVMYEAGFAGFDLHDRLVSDGIACVVTPPHTVSEEKCNKQKNDRTDCRRLAKNLQNNDYRECFVPDRQLREDRQISRCYGQVQGDIVRLKNRIRRTLEWHGLDGLFQPGRWSDTDYAQVLPTLKQHNVSESLLISFGHMFAVLSASRQTRKEILKELAKLRKKERYARPCGLLVSTPGGGPLTAIRLALEWGDLSRFKRKEQFSSFLGLIPGDYSSGDNERKGHITKQGNRAVRKWLVESAWVAIRKDPALLEKYQRVTRASGSKKKAIVATARKLALRMRTVLLTNTVTHRKEPRRRTRSPCHSDRGA